MDTTSEGILRPESSESNSTHHILTADEFEALMNYVDPEPIKTALMALYKKGDLIEVRAWDKQHNVYTGRYTRCKKLLEDIKLLNEDCDVYYVLNPVGDKHGLRDLSRGGLCTWEQDVPWRRFFLLDFDPKRECKIATHEQWLTSFDAACKAKTWLESFGFKGIVLASSGNGCHLLVPCELSNDAEGKEIVRKVQRIVANKFSTADVECECFPDANRLVRAYGTLNMKGTETVALKHRQSEILIPASGKDENPKEILLRIIAENPIPDSKMAKHSGGEGPFSRDMLYARLEAWAEKYEGEDGEGFVFEETDRRDGFRILCPGNTKQGWQDGEQHETVGEPLNDSCIVYVENGWPRFSCRHNHCGEGAAHGKKTWKDLQNFYDPDRAFHRTMDETDYAAKWNLEYVDDGIEDMGEANVDEVLAASKVQVTVNDSRGGTDGGQTTDFERSIGKTPEIKRLLKVAFGSAPVFDTKPEANAVIEAEQDDADEPVLKTISSHTAEQKQQPEPAHQKLYEMPESCMYGWLGDVARKLETPLGFAYPAVLTKWAAQIQVFPKHVRPTLYTCLLGSVHCGKSETIKRADAYIHLFDADAVKWTVPGSDRGLINIFGGKKQKDDKDEKAHTETPKTRLLLQDELRNTIAKANIQGSSLPSTLCSLWSRDEAGAADKTGEHICLVRLNILGALKADDAEDFAEVFGKESTTGLYDRFVFGIASKGWKYHKWECPIPVKRAPKGCEIPGHIFQMLEEWRDVDAKTRGRLCRRTVLSAAPFPHAPLLAMRKAPNSAARFPGAKVDAAANFS